MKEMNYPPTHGAEKVGDVYVKPALIVDLDQTVRFNLKNPEGFISLEDGIGIYLYVEEKLKLYRDAGYLVFALTNQAGVAHGYKTVQQVEHEIFMTESMLSMKSEEPPWHAIYTAYMDGKGSVPGLNYRTLMRKPDYGALAMMEWDAQRHGVIVDWEESLMVGDRTEDYRCAKNADIYFLWAWDFFSFERPDSSKFYAAVNLDRNHLVNNPFFMDLERKWNETHEVSKVD